MKMSFCQSRFCYRLIFPVHLYATTNQMCKKNNNIADNNMNHVAAQISWVDRIPFVGHLKSLIYYCEGKNDLSAEAFKCATHNTGGACFGVVGGLLAGPVGSVFGGIFGGFSADISIYILSSYRYGYADKFWDRNMEKVDWIGLLKLATIDGTIGITVFSAQKLTMEYLTKTTVKGQSEGGIKCVWGTCVKPDFTKDGVRMENREIVEGTKIPVDDISQLKSGHHVVNERGSGKSIIYDHHAIVGEVYQEEGTYTVYEQSPNMNGSQIGKASIKENLKKFDKKSLFIIDHVDTLISRVEAKERAHYICHHARDGFLNKAYNLLINNCEHFAYYCATGQHKSHQIQHILNMVEEKLARIFILVVSYVLYLLLNHIFKKKT